MDGGPGMKVKDAKRRFRGYSVTTDGSRCWWSFEDYFRDEQDLVKMWEWTQKSVEAPQNLISRRKVCSFLSLLLSLDDTARAWRRDENLERLIWQTTLVRDSPHLNADLVDWFLAQIRNSLKKPLIDYVHLDKVSVSTALLKPPSSPPQDSH